jgi:hypothetical protein
VSDDVVSRKPCDDPGVASAEKGEVLLDGPDGIAISMTADAAETTARGLHEAAQEARRQLDAGDERRR